MKLFFIFLVNVCFSVELHAQAKTLLPEQQRLDVFQGHWTVEGSEATYLEICSRIQGAHIQCVSASKEKGVLTVLSVIYLICLPRKRMSIMDYILREIPEH